MIISHTYSGNPLDRSHRERHDEQTIAAVVDDPGSLFLPLKELSVPVTDPPQGGLGWMSFDQWRRLGSDGQPVFLGRLNGAACFAVDVSQRAGALQDWCESGKCRFIDARSAVEFLSGPECGIVAQARSHVDWHNRNGFCSKCGHETVIKRGGQVRYCANCDTEHYPRTDPVVIVVVADGESCLLGRPLTRPGRNNWFTALAGFVDQGESIEEAVAREVMEEAGISVKNVRYHSSQPWPFPSSLMIGCHAEAASTDISFDDVEMANVRWFHRSEVLLALEGKNEGLTIPGPMAIAYHLIRAWAVGEAK